MRSVVIFVLFFVACVSAGWFSRTTPYALWLGELDHYAIDSPASVVVCLDTHLPVEKLILRIYAADRRGIYVKVPLTQVIPLDVDTSIMDRPRRCFRLAFRMPQLKYRYRWITKKRLRFGLYRHRRFWFAQRLNKSRRVFTLRKQPKPEKIMLDQFTQQLDHELSKALVVMDIDEMACLKAAGAKIVTPVPPEYQGLAYAVKQHPKVFDRLFKLPWSTAELNEMLWSAISADTVTESTYMDKLVQAGADLHSLEDIILTFITGYNHDKNSTQPVVVTQVQLWIQEGRFDQDKVETALRTAFENENEVVVRALLDVGVNATWINDQLLMSSSTAILAAFWDNGYRFRDSNQLRTKLNTCVLNKDVVCVQRLVSVLHYEKLKRGERKQYERWLNTALKQDSADVFDALVTNLPEQIHADWKKKWEHKLK